MLYLRYASFTDCSHMLYLLSCHALLTGTTRFTSAVRDRHVMAEREIHVSGETLDSRESERVRERERERERERCGSRPLGCRGRMNIRAAREFSEIPSPRLPKHTNRMSADMHY